MSSMPRVTKEDVERAILKETYTLLPNGRTTVCQLTLVDNGNSGFTVEGYSACVSKDNYDKGMGEQIARENAVNKVWAYLGFELARDLAKQKMLEGENFHDRLRREYASLQLKIQKLEAFLGTTQYQLLNPVEQDDQKEQLILMKGYSHVLDRRLCRLNDAEAHSTPIPA